MPAFAVDMSGGKYLGKMGRRFEGMVHIRKQILHTNFALIFNHALCPQNTPNTATACDVKVRLPSDWLPTFLSLANSSHLVEGLGLDGVDQTHAFRTGDQVGGGCGLV